MKFSIYEESRQGGRSNNEDRVAYCYSREALLMVAADGMGGHVYGEIASRIAVETLTDSFRREALPNIDDPFRFLQKGIVNAHQAILDYALRHRLPDSPRTTCVACLVQDNVAYWAHAGDSRLYLLRGGKLMAQTRDHSRVRLLIEEGIINEAQAAVHPERNKIYSCLGGEQAPEIDFSRKTPLERGDVLLLCTDGLWGMLSPGEIAVALHGADLANALPALLAQAETRGGKQGDNLSAVAARWEQSYAEIADGPAFVPTLALDEDLGRPEDPGRDPASGSGLSEDEIEKAIAEIRAAINEYSPKK